MGATKRKTMKFNTTVTAAVLGLMLAGAPFGGLAADSAAAPKEKAKPYPLTTCVVSGEKLGEMGDPYVFTYEGQEIKLCCKSCQKDFNKNPKKFLKKIAQGEAKAKKK